MPLQPQNRPLGAFLKALNKENADPGANSAAGETYSKTQSEHAGTGARQEKITSKSAAPALTEQRLHLRQRLIQFGCVLAAAAGVVGLAAAFAADDRCNRLNDFAGLNFRGELR